MTFAPSILDAQILTCLRTFLVSVLPSTVEVVKGQVNRVPEPASPDFVLMTPILRERSSTNVDTFTDVAFTASISGVLMNVTALQIGTIPVGATLVGGTGVIFGTTVVAQISGSVGGTGVYQLSQSQNVASGTVAAGSMAVLQSVVVTIQCDVHGPNSADNAQIISTLLRDEYAVSQFFTYGPDVTPLYTSDPRQVPFDNGEQQIEYRWSVDVKLYANAIITVPQQAMTQITLPTTDVTATYPPVPL